MTRLTNDVQQVQMVVRMALVMMFRAPGMFVGALIMAFTMNARLALVILVVLPLLSVGIGLVLKTAFPRFTVMQKAIDQLNSGVQEALTNVRVIKSFVREDLEEQKLEENNKRLKDMSLRAMNVVIVTMPMMTPVSYTHLDVYKRQERAHQATLKLQNGYAPFRAIWNHIIRVSVTDLKKNYSNLNVTFDLWKGESDAEPYIPKLINLLTEKGLAYESQGALVVDVAEETDTKEIPPCLVRKSDGAAPVSYTHLNAHTAMRQIQR